MERVIDDGVDGAHAPAPEQALDAIAPRDDGPHADHRARLSVVASREKASAQSGEIHGAE